MISDGRGITLPCPFQNFRGLAAPRVGKSSSTGLPLGFDTAGAPHGDGAEVVAGVGVGAPHPGGALGFEGATVPVSLKQFHCKICKMIWAISLRSYSHSYLKKHFM